MHRSEACAAQQALPLGAFRSGGARFSPSPLARIVRSGAN